MLCNPQNLTDRWDYIDLLEFLGMLFVIMYHSTTYSYSFIENNGSIHYIRYYLRTVLSTCVPLFFFANGYLLLNRRFDFKKHIIKIINIIFLTGIWGIINILFLMPIEHEYLSIKEFMVYLWTWHQGWINHLWYMGALVCIYIFFPILKIVYDTKKSIFIYFTVACAILTFGNNFLDICGTICASTLFSHEVSLLGANLFNMFNPFRGMYGYAFVYFCVGGLAHGFTGKIKNVKPLKRNLSAALSILISCAGLFITGIILSKISGEIWDVVWYGYDTVFTFVNVCAVFALTCSYSASKNNIVNKFIFTVSCNTLGIYYIHEIFIHLTKPVVEEWVIAQNYLGCIIYSFAIMAVSLLTVLILKKIPLINYLVDLKKAEKKICK